MEIEFNTLWCLLPMGITALGALSLVSYRVKHSPYTHAMRDLYNASKLEGEQVGLYIKKNVYDAVPEKQAAAQSVNPVTNALLLGAQNRRAKRELHHAQKEAQIVKNQMEAHMVGKIKGVRTCGEFILYGGLASAALGAAALWINTH